MTALIREIFGLTAGSVLMSLLAAQVITGYKPTASTVMVSVALMIVAYWGLK